MCGIIGYSGHRPAVPVCMEGLKRLEYRGYDSAGLAFVQGRELHVVKTAGRVADLDKALLAEGNVLSATTAIAHTRWATHGVPNTVNAHPHLDTGGKIALNHNGIMENFQAVREELRGLGYTFVSETDTEVLVNLISHGLDQTGSMLKALSYALSRAEGTYAVVVIHRDHPGLVWGARKASPLVFGLGTGENFLASDVPAFLPYTKRVVFLDDGELVQMNASSYKIMRVSDLSSVDKPLQTIAWDLQSAQKGGNKHFMLKEIFEQPRVITDCLTGRLDRTAGTIRLPELDPLPVPERLHIVACGTSSHAGLWGKYLIESWARLPVSVDIASEFRYRDPIIGKNDLVLALSQSGETLDTLEGLRVAREKGATVLGLCNVLGSTIAREADHVIYTQAGPEISVASTKAMCSQLVLLTLLALSWGRAKGTLAEDTASRAIAGLTELPKVLEEALPAMRRTALDLSRRYAEAASFLYLGRGPYFPLALEGALKLKEISYIHAEGFAAGEMKHGPIALIDPKFPTFALAPDDGLLPKVKSNLLEVQARGGRIIALTHEGTDLHVDHPWYVPKVWGPLNTFVMLPALQLFAYEMADYLGKDVDQPRNLAKSVTVE
jgi:glucosamine--fructose-6-phosphate aminotransferase (isomerizing)